MLRNFAEVLTAAKRCGQSTVSVAATQDRDVLLWEAEQVLLEQGVVDYGDLIVLTIGEPIGASGGTNTLKIVRVGEHHMPGTLDDPV